MKKDDKKKSFLSLDEQDERIVDKHKIGDIKSLMFRIGTTLPLPRIVAPLILGIRLNCLPRLLTSTSCSLDI